MTNHYIPFLTDGLRGHRLAHVPISCIRLLLTFFEIVFFFFVRATLKLSGLALPSKNFLHFCFDFWAFVQLDYEFLVLHLDSERIFEKLTCLFWFERWGFALLNELLILHLKVIEFFDEFFPTLFVVPFMRAQQVQFALVFLKDHLVFINDVFHLFKLKSMSCVFKADLV